MESANGLKPVNDVTKGFIRDQKKEVCGNLPGCHHAIYACFPLLLFVDLRESTAREKMSCERGISSLMNYEEQPKLYVCDLC